MGKRKNQRCKQLQNKIAKRDSPPSLMSMPTEILLKIFGLVGELRELTPVCKRFYEIIGSELLLVISSSKLEKGFGPPVIKRNYKRIQIDPYNLNPAHLDILLSSSTDSTRTLSIDPKIKGHTNKKPKIYLRTLLQILTMLPNLEELTVESVIAITPICDYEAIKPIDLPVMNKLKHLKIEDCNDVLFSIFSKVNSVERMITSRISGNSSEGYKFAKFIKLQKGLKFLQTSTFHNRFSHICLPELHWLVVCPDYRLPEQTFVGENLPQLKKLLIRSSNQLECINFLKRFKSSSLKRLQVDCSLTESQLEDALKNYPSLNYVKTYTFQRTWTK